MPASGGILTFKSVDVVTPDIVDYSSDEDDPIFASLQRASLLSQTLVPEVHRCGFCDAEGAASPCAMCQSEWYCNRDCLRRDARRHRVHCIYKKRLSQGTSSESESSESEDDSEPEPSRKVSLRSSWGDVSDSRTKKLEKKIREGREETVKEKKKSLTAEPLPVNAIDGDGLEKGLKKTSEAVPHATVIDVLTEKERAKLQQMMKRLEDMEAMYVDRMRQLDSLPSPGVVSSPSLASPANDTIMQELRDLKECVRRQSLPAAPSAGVYAPPASASQAPLMTVREDPAMAKYFKLQAMGMPQEHVKAKMAADGLDPSLLDRPDEPSPNAQRHSLPSYLPATTGTESAPAAVFPSGVSMQQVVAAVMQMYSTGQIPGTGADGGQAQGAFSMPFSPGVSATTAAASGGTSGVAAYTFASVTAAATAVATAGSVSPSLPTKDPEQSVEDQMRAELAEAENAINSIFGEEEVTNTSLTVVQELEQRARKQQNKKLVEHKRRLVETLRDVVERRFKRHRDGRNGAETFEDEEEDMARIVADIQSSLKRWLPTLESMGLTLGSTAEQTWSNRLLIRSKETGGWHFSEEERKVAGLAYVRLWTMRDFVQFVSPLRDLTTKIRKAPQTFGAQAKDSAVLLDKYEDLLKQLVRLRVKIFKSKDFPSAVQTMKKAQLPIQALDEASEELMEAAAELMRDALRVVRSEQESLAQTTSAGSRRLRAPFVLYVGEKAGQLWQAARTMGVELDAEGVEAVRARTLQLKQECRAAQRDEDVDLI